MQLPFRVLPSKIISPLAIRALHEQWPLRADVWLNHSLADQLGFGQHTRPHANNLTITMKKTLIQPAYCDFCFC